MINGRRLTKQLSLLLIVAMLMTGCGQQSEAMIDGNNGGSYKLPEPITVSKVDEADKNRYSFLSEKNPPCQTDKQR